MLRDWVRVAIPNHFVRSVLGTDKGKARLEGVASIECDYSTICGLDALEVLSRPGCEGPTAGANGFARLASTDAALLGLTTKFLTFDNGAAKQDASGLNLIGSGTESALIRVDIPFGPPEARDGSEPRSYDRASSPRAGN